MHLTGASPYTAPHDNPGPAAYDDRELTAAIEAANAQNRREIDEEAAATQRAIADLMNAYKADAQAMPRPTMSSQGVQTEGTQSQRTQRPQAPQPETPQPQASAPPIVPPVDATQAFTYSPSFTPPPSAPWQALGNPSGAPPPPQTAIVSQSSNTFMHNI